MSGLSGLSSAVSWKSLTGSSVVWLCRAVGEIGKRGFSDGGWKWFNNGVYID